MHNSQQYLSCPQHKPLKGDAGQLLGSPWVRGHFSAHLWPVDEIPVSEEVQAAAWVHKPRKSRGAGLSSRRWAREGGPGQGGLEPYMDTARAVEASLWHWENLIQVCFLWGRGAGPEEQEVFPHRPLFWPQWLLVLLNSAFSLDGATGSCHHAALFGLKPPGRFQKVCLSPDWGLLKLHELRALVRIRG